jgi:hypothetical protein
MSEMVWAEGEAGRVVGATAAAETIKPAPLAPAEMIDLSVRGDVGDDLGRGRGEESGGSSGILSRRGQRG